MDRNAISAAWGVVAVVLGGSAATTWTAAESPESTFPAWPAWVFSTLTAAAVYLCFASLFRLWPAHGAPRGANGSTPASGVTDNTEQPMSGAQGAVPASTIASDHVSDVAAFG